MIAPFEPKAYFFVKGLSFSSLLVFPTRCLFFVIFCFALAALTQSSLIWWIFATRRTEKVAEWFIRRLGIKNLTKFIARPGRVIDSSYIGSILTGPDFYFPYIGSWQENLVCLCKLYLDYFFIQLRLLKLNLDYNDMGDPSFWLAKYRLHSWIDETCRISFFYSFISFKITQKSFSLFTDRYKLTLVYRNIYWRVFR